jgi:isopenicillin N synthase-like dioxygenase
MQEATANPIAPQAGAVEIPILDLGPFLAGEPGALEKTAEKLRWASENVGFYYFLNHGVPQALIDQTFAQAKRFHDQPLDEKLKLKVNEHMQGYMPMKASTTRSSDLTKNNKPNQNEAFFIQRETHGSDPNYGKRYYTPNQWPERLPAFREAVLEYYAAMDQLCQKVLPIYGVALGMGMDFFMPAFRRPHAGFRMTHYPATAYVENEYGIAPHTDSSFITVLAQNRLGGLQIKTTSGDWVDAPAVADTFIINTGDILNRWTNGHFLSTPHRAFNVTPAARYAIPYFLHPDPDYPMKPVPTCVSEANPARFPTQTTDEYMAWFTGKNYDHIRAQRNIKE